MGILLIKKFLIKFCIFVDTKKIISFKETVVKKIKK